MNEIKKLMEELGCMIEHKEILIRNQEDEIKSLKRLTKECYNEGLSDGMNKAWNLAERIVRLDWVGNDTIKTVEDWFELLTVKDAMEVMEMLNEKKPYWKADIVRNVYECSECGFPSLIKHKFCPDCGVKMKL